jgi:hypothetical protein
MSVPTLVNVYGVQNRLVLKIKANEVSDWSLSKDLRLPSYKDTELSNCSKLGIWQQITDVYIPTAHTKPSISRICSTYMDRFTRKFLTAACMTNGAT